jgi:hypothetical protein
MWRIQSDFVLFFRLPIFFVVSELAKTLCANPRKLPELLAKGLYLIWRKSCVGTQSPILSSNKAFLGMSLLTSPVTVA